MDGAEVEGGALRHMHGDVVHRRDQLAEGVREGAAQALAVLHCMHVQEPASEQE